MHRRERQRADAAGARIAGRLDQLGVPQVEQHPGLPERQQPLQRRRARTERRRAAHHRRLPLRLGVVEQRPHQPLAAPEPPEHRALADARRDRPGHPWSRRATPTSSTSAAAAVISASRLRAASRRSGGRRGEEGERLRHGAGHSRARGRRTSRGFPGLGNGTGPRSVSTGMTDTRVLVLVGSLRADSAQPQDRRGDP